MEIAAQLRLINTELKTVLRTSVYHNVRFWSALAAGMTVSVGLGLFLGTDQRISTNAYWMIATYGGHLVWGFVFIVAAAVTGLCVWQYPHWLRFALLTQAIPYAAISLSFAAASIKYPDANLTAAPVYAWVMIMHAALSDYARREF